MNLLTIVGLLPLISALIIALLPKGNNELIKRVALAATVLIAIASVFLATGLIRHKVDSNMCRALHGSQLLILIMRLESMASH